ncbi:hypothetical protein LSUB1_G005033 [Lachnellula subtilissima]|uniref:Heterokaryon incompatibility domain-containing protein n=1 Tax=Lachnellula subtilissima TaxID=602034 RepID=A0A8H8RSV4_9HELO|nr:hypothetical protein LSUB1_G005033 [Lachnellula subtilissima]
MTDTETLPFVPKPKICPKCINIFACWDQMQKATIPKPGKNYYEVSDWYKDGQEYTTSAKTRGCVVCMLLLEGRLESEKDEFQQLLQSSTKLELVLTIRNWNHMFDDSDSDADSSLGSENLGSSGPENEVGDRYSRFEGDDGSDKGSKTQSATSRRRGAPLGTTSWVSDSDDDTDSDAELSRFFPERERMARLPEVTIESTSQYSDSEDDTSFEIICEIYQVSENGEKTRLNLSHNGTYTPMHVSLVLMSDAQLQSLDLPAETRPLEGSSSNTAIHERNPSEDIPKILSAKLEPSTGSTKSLAWAKKKLKNCRDLHPKMCGAKNATTLPTRLLSITDSGTRLCNSAGLNETPQYATLSHCWGSIEMFKLLKENVDSFQEQLPVEKLCKTFQDAITVTRSLGLHLLWIDSLCIFQDNEEDWRQEASLMSEVYANAVVTIAAAGAKDGSVGLFSERDVLRESKHYVKIPTDDHKIYELKENRLIERCLERTCLKSRGWCFQERFLTERTLHFTKNQIVFECNITSTCESEPQALLPRDLEIDNAKRITPNDKLLPEFWYKAVCVYSSAQLTFSEDKLIAISGVARHIQSMSGDEYIAGLWRKDIEMQLCWRVDRERFDSASPSTISPPQSLPTSPPYQAPSWSWASINGPILWELDSFSFGGTRSPECLDNLVKVRKADVVPVGADSMGQLSAAKLEVECGPPIKCNAMFSQFELNVMTSGHGLDDREENSSPCFRADGLIWLDHGDQRYPAESLFFLPVTEYKATTRSPSGICGIIITKATSRGQGYFQRVGVWDMPCGPLGYEQVIEKIRSQPDSFMDDSLYYRIRDVVANKNRRYRIMLV